MEEKKSESITVSLEDEMRRSYLDYAMSVIIGRALPDASDGLKPVHRRNLWSMWESSNTWDKPFKKSARIVGDVMGKYHPHGEAAIYDTLVRMAQDFTLRYPLIEGQGNFGSIDGDPPAAMRYTEVRLNRISKELMGEIEKDTVPFNSNYDGSLKEPAVLPARFPNLLINGSSGIAVGMATNIPPHNMNEIIDGLIYLINKENPSMEDLIDIIKGPDFPTGGFILGKKGIREAYLKGKGLITIRAKAAVEKKAKDSIIITEIPYQVNKARILEKIGELIRERNIEGVAEFRDESDKDGLRIVLDLKKDASPQVILNNLYKHTALQTTYGIIFLALADNQPKMLNLMEMLNHFLNFRREVVRKRTEFELRQSEKREHVLEGLRIALNNIEKVVQIIKKSKKTEEAIFSLMKEFPLSKLQAQSILDMQLGRLTGLEREKIEEELNNLKSLILKLKETLADPKKIMEIVKKELIDVKNEYGDERRTSILEDSDFEIDVEDTIPEEEMVITHTSSGYVKRSPLSSYRFQGRGGKGKIGIKMKDEDEVQDIFVSTSHSYLLVFTNKGRMHWIKVLDIPDVSLSGRGRSIINLINIKEDEKVKAIVSLRDFREKGFIVMMSNNGLIKKTSISFFKKPRINGIIAMSIEKKDELLFAEKTDGKREVVIGTHYGKIIRFNEKSIRPMGRNARGVKSIKIVGTDKIVGMSTISENDRYIFTVTEKGYGKKTIIEEYKSQNRGGVGIKNIKTTNRVGMVCGISTLKEKDTILLVSSKGKVIRIKTEEIRPMSRYAQGVKLINLDEDDRLVSLAKVKEEL
ncbi:MAG: DNA gyrase subunit A [Acidobacteriota bacterium]